MALLQSEETAKKGGESKLPPFLDQSVFETDSVIRLEIIDQGRALWL
jgi:hypothetical protein